MQLELKTAFAHRHYNVVHWSASKPEKNDNYKEMFEIDLLIKPQPAMDGIWSHPSQGSATKSEKLVTKP